MSFARPVRGVVVEELLHDGVVEYSRHPSCHLGGYFSLGAPNGLDGLDNHTYVTFFDSVVGKL